MHEHMEGKGLLRTLGPSPEEWEVTYAFNIDADTEDTPSLQTLVVDLFIKGTIDRTDGSSIAAGEYDLETDNGEILRVMNVGANDWTILSTDEE